MSKPKSKSQKPVRSSKLSTIKITTSTAKAGGADLAKVVK